MNEEKSDLCGGGASGMLYSLKEDYADVKLPEVEGLSATAPLPERVCEDDVLEMDEEFNYDGFQVVRREFFAHINEPSVTFNNYKFYVNTACLKRFPQAEFVQVLVNQESKTLAIRPCLPGERDACAWCCGNPGKRKPKQITCKMFFAKVFTMMGWNLDYRYKLLGRVIHSKDEWLIAFDLTATEVYQRVRKDGGKPKTSRMPVFPEGWKTQFGLPFREHQKSMQVNIFDGYAVYGLRDNVATADVSDDSTAPKPDTGTESNLIEEDADYEHRAQITSRTDY